METCKDIFKPAPIKPNTDPYEFVNDPVNNPEHYTYGGVECIDAMIETQGPAEVINFCVCNAFKYLWRHGHKNGNEDIDKAAWYLNKAVELRHTYFEEVKR